jgi:HlyD family secretion protein
MKLWKFSGTIVPVLILAACGEADNPYRVVGELTSDRVEITAESSEPIDIIVVDEGESVDSGQLLFKQNAERATARLAEAEANMGQAQARLSELVRGPRSEQIKAARANEAGAIREVRFREAEHERIRMLSEQNLASPDLLDRAQAALDAAEASLSLRRAQLEEMLAGTTVEELDQAEQAVKRAQAGVDNAGVDLSRLEVLAPVSGVIDSRLFEQGERPQPGQPVLVLLPGEQPHARVYVPEILRVQIGPGTKALIHVDGLEEPIAGLTRWVASEAAFTPYFALTERDRGRLSFIAKVDIDETRNRLPDGVPVEVEFIVNGTGQ